MVYWRRLWYGDLFGGLVHGSRFLMLCFDWLPFSLPYWSCVWLGEAWNLGIHPVVSTGLVIESLSANHMRSMGEVLLVGELHDYRVVSHDMWTTFGHRALLRRRLFVTGSDCFGNSFRLDFQFLARIDNVTFPCIEMFVCWSEGVGIQLYLVAHFFNADGIVSEVGCSDHAHM